MVGMSYEEFKKKEVFKKIARTEGTLRIAYKTYKDEGFNAALEKLKSLEIDALRGRY